MWSTPKSKNSTTVPKKESNRNPHVFVCINKYLICYESGERQTTPFFLSTPQMMSQFTNISSDHTFFRPVVAFVFSDVFFTVLLHFQRKLVPKLTLGPFLTLSVRNGHKLKGWGFRIPAHIESISR